MAIGVNDVKALVDTKRDCTPFLNAAVLLVSEEFTCTNLSSARLDLITTYLAAHFLVLTEENGGLTSSKLGDAEEQYIPISSYRDPLKGFNMTRWGQQAMSVDTSGTLANLQANSGLKAQFRLKAQKRDPSWTGWESEV